MGNATEKKARTSGFQNTIAAEGNVLNLKELILQNYEIKNSEDQSALIDSFESNEENQIKEEALLNQSNIDDIPTGVSIESASYMENNHENKDSNFSFENHSQFHDFQEI